MHSASRREVVVVGAGQAGLAMGYFLARVGRDFTILEAAEELGAAWRQRWDSLSCSRRCATAAFRACPFLATAIAIPRATRSSRT